MNDVAKHAGVSVSTVSYVLNRSGPVGAARRERVLDAMRMLDYTPNASARSLKRRSALTIGLAVPDIAEHFSALLAAGVERTAGERGVLVALCATEGVTGEGCLHAQLLASQRLDGIIHLSGARARSRLAPELARSGSVVLVDEQLPGLEVPAVVCEQRGGACRIAQHVLEHGHRRIAILAGPVALWTAEQRLAGYRDALAAAGIDPCEAPVLTGEHLPSSGTERAARVLAVRPEQRPTALLCGDDAIALGAIEHCRSAGLRVPEDVSIVGFGDMPAAALLTPRLTTVRRPAERLGREAAATLFEQLDEGGARRRSPVATELVVRDSVVAPAMSVR
ncbi:MAG: LacI family DNA-binding transcriptional regulator [Solirubrobacteraceae bacterium]